MKALFQRFGSKLSPSLKELGGGLKTNRKLTAIIVCLLVSATFWFLIALSREYTTRLVLPVTYENFPGRKVVMNELPKTLTLSLKTSGFSILSFGFEKERQPLVVDVSSLLASAGAENVTGEISVASSHLTPEISGQLGSNLTITSLFPDSLTFNFGSRSSRIVPVHVNATVSFERQYDSLDAHSVMPYEVEITGPESVLRTVPWIETEPVVETNVRTDIRKKLKLVLPAHVECSTADVLFYVPVQKFTEGSVDIPLRAVNVPADLSLRTFPDKVQVRFLVPLSRYAQVKPSLFEAMVDAGQAKAGGPSRLQVTVTSAPGYVRSVSVDPERVEFILRKK